MYLAVHTMGDPMTLAGALRTAVATIDRDQPVYDMRTIEQRLSGRLATRRFNVFLLGTFAALALVLATVGVYGVISYLVTQRNHEIGIRMALGARPGDVRWLVAAQGLRVIVVGLCIGLVAAFAITRVLRSFLFGISPTDPATFAGVSLVLGLVTFLAFYLPARRATKVDPMVTLRHE
jgi:putative ABC transport system permease protein